MYSMKNLSYGQSSMSSTYFLSPHLDARLNPQTNMLEPSYYTCLSKNGIS